MIEQIQGAGQSGMTGKSTKHGKNSLFAKLLAMLEKNAELSGKGKGLQLNAGKSGKAKGLAGLTEKTDPFTVAKSKHLLALAVKGKADGKDKVDDEAAASLLAVHVIIDPKSYVKTSNKAAKTSVLIAGQLGEQVGVQSGGQAAKYAADKGVETSLEKDMLSKGGVLNKGTDKGDAFLNTMAQGGGGKTADALVAQQKGLQTQQAQSTSSESVALAAGDAEVSLATASKKILASEQSAKVAQLAKTVQAENTQTIANKTELNAALRSALDGQQVGAAVQGNHSLGEKKLVKTASEHINTAAAAALFQQVKAAQPQQTQQLANAPLTTAAQGAVVDASLADSSSQFSDNKGGQDARSLNAAMVDVKSTASSSSANTSFHNYLSNKTAPLLSPFDSMNYIAQSAKNGQTRLEIQLDPVNLGKIQISLQSDASKHLQIHMIVDQSMTRAALEQQLPQLRSALAQQGFDLSGFSMDSQGQQTSTGGDTDGRKSHRFGNDTDTLTADASLTAPQQQTATGSGLSIRV